MIKKMLAMLAVVSCAFGAWADATHISGTDFSTHLTGDFITGRDDSGAATQSTYWYNGNTNDFSGTIVLGTNGTDHVLDFESNITNPVYRTIEGCYGRTVANFEPHAVGGGLFVDTYVAFTPYLVNNDHAAPTKVTPQDKIMVWVRETEVEEGANITNLIVTAGYYDAQSSFTASNYVANLESAQVSALCNGGLQRLTIKSFANITTYTGYYLMGFVVYINETPVSYTADAFEEGCPFAALDAGPRRYYESTHMLFPSLAGYSNNSADSTLTSVGYAGVGQVGNIYFDDYSTSYPSFAGDDLDFDVVMSDGVTSYVYDNVTYTTNATFTVLPSTETITISGVQYDTVNGWKHKTGTWHNGTNVVNNAEGVGGDTGTFTLFPDALTLTLAGFKANYLVFDGVTTNEYQTLSDAFAHALQYRNLILNNDVIITEEITSGFPGSLAIEDGSLTIDLNGHTIRGTGVATIVNVAGTLTITDTSDGQTGKVLGCLIEEDPFNNYQAILIAGGSTLLEAGTYDLIALYENGEPEMSPSYANNLLITGGSYICAPEDEDHPEVQPSAFYLADSVQSGKTISWDYDTASGYWYATVGDAPVVTTYAVTFSTNTVVVAEWTTNIAENAALGGAIPDVSGLSGSWDAPAPTAETIITQATNFNFTVTPPVVTYEVTFSTNNIAVAEYNTNIVAGATLPDAAIPAFTGGAWDLDPTNAVINAATNFNYTISSDPWAPEAQTDAAASNKVVQVFGAGSDVANHVDTLAEYNALVTYIKSVTSQSEVPTDLTADQKTWMWKSFILGADEFFESEPEVEITSLTANSAAGKWDFTVQVTEGADVIGVAADKVAALVKIRTSLSTGPWVAPTAGNIEAARSGNEINVTVNFGDGTSGFMKVAE